MAILSGVPGLEANIRVEGIPLEEYQDEHESGPDTPSQVTRFVEATSGATFDIRLYFAPYFQPLENIIGIEIAIDGTVLDKPLIFEDVLEGNYFHNYGHERISQGCKRGSNGSYKLHPFQFAHLDIDHSTNDNPGLDVNKITDLGEIKIEFHHKKLLDKINSPRFSWSIEDVGTISEKTLKGKAVSHRAKLGEATSVNTPTIWNSEFIDPQGKPFAVFKFRYRSKEALKAACIIPRTPSPIPIGERPEEELTSQELRELLRQERARNANVKQERRIKRERAEASASTIGGNDSEVEALKEPPAKFRKATETVDLTGGADSDDD